MLAFLEFDNAYWVTVSGQLSYVKLQVSAIARLLKRLEQGLDFLHLALENRLESAE